MTFDLFSLGDSVRVVAAEDGVRVTSKDPQIDISRKDSWPSHVLSLPGGWKAAVQIEQLLERGLAGISADGLLLPYSNMDDAVAESLDITVGWVQPAPYLLKIDRYSDLGLSDFRYRFQLLEEGRPAVTERVGYFIRRIASQTVFRLESQMYALIEAMDDFNAKPSEERTQQNAWLTFAKVKGCATSVGAALDSTLAKVDVVVPSAIGLDMRENDDGSLTFLPKCPEIGATEFQHVFERNSDVEGLYSIDRPGLGKVRIVLSDIQKEVLRRMKRVNRVSGRLKDELAANPAQVFDGVLDAVDLPYSERVIGIGDFRFAPVPRTTTGPSEMAPILNDAGQSTGSPGPKQDAGSEHSADTHTTSDTRPSESHGQQVLNAPSDGTDGAHTEPEPEKTGKKYLLIDTHEEAVGEQFLQAARHAAATATQLQPFQRPKSLVPTFTLHPHQEAGIHWLQICRSVKDRQGVLLADDMGLGKTLQILSFLSWAIESDSFPDVSRPKPPYRPILIVVPLILLENRTWENEMERFFTGSGSIFLPTLQLHGKTLERFRARTEGSETDIGKPVLDLDRLQQHRVVITNYETIRNYQHSFAYLKDGKSLWSVIVTDEAQEYKIPNSKISHALKAITSDFEIASTGTPVENRLLDLWNIMDAVQPGLLRSSKEFTERFERHADEFTRDQSLQALKEELLFQKPHAFVLRREKAHLTSLPKKNVVRLKCEMTSAEVDCHRNLIRQMEEEDQAAKFLVALHKLSRLYQHPALVDSDADDASAATLIATSSKLRRVIEECHKIRIRREKAILFARHIAVQSMLAKVLQEEFQIPVRIINGATARGTRGIVTTTRTGILEEFKSKPGFNLLVLSPFVAGIGLTITEANHVFHYGRWWNPAVELQATDRVYRIGQEKDVFVYLPILTDKSGRIPLTFDERLDRLMERKYKLAEDFLRPLPSEDSMATELREELLKTD
jgi:hypothetical protein